MTNQEINIAIAEACGWRYAGPIEAKQVATACWYAPGNMEWHQQLLPDHCSDLNAMHEAEMTLGRSDKYIFREILRNIMPDDFASAYHANARQRAEAFLRTIGKWKEDV